MIKIGDKVEFRFFNTPDGRFYGDYFTGEVMDIDKDHFTSGLWYGQKIGYLVKSEARQSASWLHRKEIKRIIR